MSEDRDDDPDVPTLPDRRPGPVDDGPWPTELRGHVVDPRPPPRLHGYDVSGDLARHYDWGEVVLTTLRGEAPTEAEGGAFNHAMVLLLPQPVTEAPAHAAVLSRLVGSASSSVAATGAVVLAEQARDLVTRFRDELPWLLGEGEAASQETDASASEEARPREEAPAIDARALERLSDDLAAIGHPCTRLDRASCLEAAALAVLRACGLRQSWQLETALMMTRLPCVVAEARHHRTAKFDTYPMNRPEFRYRDPNRKRQRGGEP